MVQLPLFRRKPTISTQPMSNLLQSWGWNQARFALFLLGFGFVSAGGSLLASCSSMAQLPVSAGGMPGIILPTQEDGLLVLCGGATLLHVEHVQLEGRNRVTDREFMNGARIEPGERFGS